jgi:hypothetical protein
MPQPWREGAPFRQGFFFGPLGVLLKQNMAIDDATVKPPASSWTPSLGMSLIGCLLGTLVGMGVIHAIDPYFPYANLPELGISPPPELVAKHHAARIEFQTRNYGLDFGLMGLILGGCVGLIATGVRRVPSAIAGGIGGALGGAISAYIVGGYVAQAIIASADQSLLQSSAMHVPVWASIFGVALLMIGLVQASPVKAISYGVIGAVAGSLAALAHNLVTPFIFGSANLLYLFPDSLSQRITWALLCSITLGLMLHLGLRDRLKSPEFKSVA